ncbi:hypothetical protein [Methanospirillum sp.]|uniref:hypothetical protein n=1 Tax=Methanospirillum sp. TaxID=45200 RepID=UPI002984617F|nr:hypothetical protein [Methanospirillum sp.]
MDFAIHGYWTTKAGDVDPQKTLTTPVSDSRFFYQVRHDSNKRQKVIIKIILDGQEISQVHDWLSNDGKETHFFDIPLKYRKKGEHNLSFQIFAPVSDAADAGPGTKIYESEKFQLIYTE